MFAVLLLCTVISASLAYPIADDIAIEPGESISCCVDITNQYCVDYYVLKWYTPLEGMRSKCLSVTRDGRVLPYDMVCLSKEATLVPENTF